MKVIFIMGSDPQLLSVLEMLLTRKGYQVLTAKPATEISTLIEQRQPDLIILDDKMGAISGAKLCRSIKNNDRMKHLPVLIFNSEPIILEEVIDSGCDLVVPKNVDASSLMAEIQILLYPANSEN